MMALLPYARTLGILIVAETDAAGRPPLLCLPPADHLFGRPGFLHGGAISGLLETAALLAARHAFGDAPVTIKPIGMTVDFLRGGKAQDSFARGRLIRNGTRIAAVEVHAWQDDESRPVAAARMNLSLHYPETASRHPG